MSIAREFQQIVRQVVVPQLAVQIHSTSPLLKALMATQRVQIRQHVRVRKPEREMQMPQGVEPLHLTEENKECIRALVRKITPNFEPELWEKVNLQRALDEERRRQELLALEAQKRQFAQQAASQGQWGVGSTIVTTTSAAMANPGPYVQVFGGGGGGGSATSTTFASVGTGFTTYGPLLPDQGLTLQRNVITSPLAALGEPKP